MPIPTAWIAMEMASPVSRCVSPGVVVPAGGGVLGWIRGLPL